MPSAWQSYMRQIGEREQRDESEMHIFVKMNRSLSCLYCDIFLLLGSFLFFFFIAGEPSVYAQEKPLKVVVHLQDALNFQHIEGAKIISTLCPDSLMHSGRGGEFFLVLTPDQIHENVSIVLKIEKQGYFSKEQTCYAQSLVQGPLCISLVPKSNAMPDVVVERKRREYSAENNPAVKLIEKVLANHSRQKFRRDYSYRKVEKQTIALANFDLNSKMINRSFPFFRKYLIPSQLDSKQVLPLSVRETVSDMGYNAEKNEEHEIIRYRRHTGIEQNLDDGTMTQRLEDIFSKVDVKEEYISLLNNRFISPLSSHGRTFYKYYLTDTIVYRGEVCQVVDYYPFNTRDFCFRGRMFFTVDSLPRLMHNDMEIPAEINLNFVNKLRIVQDYAEVFPGITQVKREEMSMYFSLYYRLLSLYTQHERVYDQYEYLSPDSLVVHAPRAIQNLSGSAEAVRYGIELENTHVISTNDGLKAFLEDVRSVPKYKVALDAVEMLTRGYIRTRYSPHLVYGGSAFDIGNIYTFLGRNKVEGQRVRLAGRTTSYFSPYFFFEGHVAYGFRDKEWKHKVMGTFSLNPKKYFRDEFPKHDLSITHEYDLYTPGQIYNNEAKDNFLYNIGTSYLTDRSYRHKWQIDYRKDWLSGFSVHLWGRKMTDRPAGSLQYIRVSRDYTYVSLPYINDTGWGIILRYAPGEKIYEGTMSKYQKIRLQRNIPIFTLSHQMSLKVLGGEFFYNRTECAIQQRLWLGAFGQLDYQLTAGKIWNNVPYPMLYTPPANTAIALNEFAFQLIRPMEYIADEYLTLFTTYHMKGLLLNRVPLVKKWGLREVVSFNWAFGNTTPLNRQETAKEIFILPSISSEMLRTGYAEIGVGLENIFRIFRLDLYRRLTSPTTHSGPLWGVKGAIVLDF